MKEECSCDIPERFLRLHESLEALREEQQEEEMTVSHLRDENRLRRSETWSQMALDSLTLSAPPLFLSLSPMHDLYLHTSAAVI